MPSRLGGVQGKLRFVFQFIFKLKFGDEHLWLAKLRPPSFWNMIVLNSKFKGELFSESKMKKVT